MVAGRVVIKIVAFLILAQKFLTTENLPTVARDQPYLVKVYCNRKSVKSLAIIGARNDGKVRRIFLSQVVNFAASFNTSGTAVAFSKI